MDDALAHILLEDLGRSVLRVVVRRDDVVDPDLLELPADVGGGNLGSYVSDLLRNDRVLPVWRGDGKELYYIAPDGKLMAVDVKTDSGFEASAPKALFDIRLKNATGWRYDISPDGQRFLANTVIGEVKPNPITLVLNWAAETKK